MSKISDSKLQEFIGWKPFPAQVEVIDSVNKNKETVLCAGRRFGKSALCGYIALKELMIPGRQIWIVSPTYDLSLKVFNYVVKWFVKVAPSQQKNISFRPTPKIKTSFGSTLECKSAENPTSLLGEELDLVIVDEAARIPRRVHDAYLAPTLAMRRGKKVSISTPLGKNAFYEEYVRAKDEGAAFSFPSNTNPTFPPEEWDRARATLPEDVFKQEYLANFMSDAAAVFRGVEEIVKGDVLRDVQPGHVYVMGADLAKHTDFTVLTVIDTYNNHVVHIDRFKDLDWNIQKARIKMVHERYNNARVILDSTGVGDPISDDLKSIGVMVDDFKYTNTSKQQLIQKLSLFIEQKLISIPNDVSLLDELSSFGYNLTDAGKVTYSAPNGYHDDCVNSLALAVWGIYSKPLQMTALQMELRNMKRSKNKNFI
jgi:hypothetical protein